MRRRRHFDWERGREELHVPVQAWLRRSDLRSHRDHDDYDDHHDYDDYDDYNSRPYVWDRVFEWWREHRLCCWR